MSSGVPDRPRWISRACGVSCAPSRRLRWLGLLAVFALAFVVRALYAADLADVMYTRLQPGTRMAWRYDGTATAILAGEGVLWPREPDPARTGILARPPGYPLYIALVYTALGRSFFSVQLVQNVLTSGACVLLVLGAARLVSFRVGLVSGFIAAVSPHLAFASNFVLSDALSAVPLLAAIVVLARAHPGPSGRWWWSALAGALVGVGAWIRPNVMLLAPFLGVLILLVALDRKRALGHALAVTAAGAAVIAPITLRNYAVFGELVPISINGGLTLWQGVADAGGEAAGARRRDKLVMDDEAATSGNPRYRDWWAEPDGIARDRDRYRRARAVIRANPALYARVVAGRMAQMLRYSGGDGPALIARPGERTAPGGSASDTAGSDSDRAQIGTPEFTSGVPNDRSHDLSRVPGDERFLAPGRAAYPLRPLLRGIQRGLVWVLTPLALLGVVALFPLGWRQALLLLALPLYYLATESFFLYEWRVAVPMHYGIFAAAAVPLVLLRSALVEGARRLRGPHTDQNQAG